MEDAKQCGRNALDRYVKNKLKREYCYVTSTDDFSTYIANEYGFDLTIEKVGDVTALRGIVLAKKEEKKVVVLLSKNNNRCWSRFTLIKEICHFFLVDKTNIAKTNISEVAESLMTHVAYIPNFLPKESTEKIEELLNLVNPLGAEEAAAILAAIEIMIPEVNKTMIKDRINRGYKLSEISSILVVPNLILEHRLQEWGFEIPLP